MTVQRKRYFQGPDLDAKDPADREKIVWFCEVSVFHEDTQNVSTAWVNKVNDDEVPAEDKEEAKRLAPKATPAPAAGRGAPVSQAEKAAAARETTKADNDDEGDKPPHRGPLSRGGR